MLFDVRFTNDYLQFGELDMRTLTKQFIFYSSSILLVLMGPGNADAQYQVLHEFSAAEGQYPMGDLATDSTFLYGMATLGGAYNHGTIFRLRTDGTDFVKLHDFDSAAGMTPAGSLALYNGILYGTTRLGGSKGGGVIFRIDTAGNNYQLLYEFRLDSTHGSYPSGTPLFYENELFGMTELGGLYNTHGVVYKIGIDGSGFTVLYGFDQPDFCQYGDRLTYFRGYMSGMIVEGQGNSSAGAVFRINKNGYGMSEVFDFNGANGLTPMGFPIVVDSLFYGMACAGGPDSLGLIFRMELNGLFYQMLHSFDKTSPGGFPRGGLLADTNMLYGFCRGYSPSTGSIFGIKPDGTNYAVLYTFETASQGYYPDGTPILYNGKLYGTTERGGAGDLGVIFSFTLMPQGIEDHSILPLISVAPNPAQDIVRITSSEEITEVLITDLAGRILLEAKIQGKEYMLDTSSLPDGVYLIRLSGRHFMDTRKLVRTSR